MEFMEDKKMSIGLLVAGLVVGGVVRHHNKKKENELEEMRRQVASLNRSHAKKCNQYVELARELNKVKNQKAQQAKVVTKTVAKYNCTKKENFFDIYRELDMKLSRIMGKNEKGISTFIKYANEKKQYTVKVPKLIKCRDYRNRLAHSKDKWQNIADPEPWMTEFVKDLLHDVKCYESRFVRLMSPLPTKSKRK